MSECPFCDGDVDDDDLDDSKCTCIYEDESDDYSWMVKLGLILSIISIVGLNAYFHIRSIVKSL